MFYLVIIFPNNSRILPFLFSNFVCRQISFPSWLVCFMKILLLFVYPVGIIYKSFFHPKFLYISNMFLLEFYYYYYYYYFMEAFGLRLLLFIIMILGGFL
jgi:hypothetical protein